MALLPFVLYDWEDLMCPNHLEQTLVCPNLHLHQPKRPSLSDSANGYMKLLPQHNHIQALEELKNLLELTARRQEGRPSPPTVNKDDFHVVLDVQHFKPEEIDVKVVDNFLIVEAKHEDKRDDHGWVSRQFVRRYKLPEDVKIDLLTSQLSSDGLLTIVAPKNQPHKDETERVLKIECTGKPFVNKKQEKAKTSEQNEEKKSE